MEIAPRIPASAWKRLTVATEADWTVGVSIFRARIEGRFLRPGRALLRLSDAGFALMGLDCLLVETLKQFREGVPETPVRQGKRYFREFLTQTSFGRHFKNAAMADLFYQTVRNGILHQAELKGSSLLRKGRRFPLVHLRPDGRGLEINRNRFHGQLEAEFRAYATEVRRPHSPLRAAFRRKMDFIAQ